MRIHTQWTKPPRCIALRFQRKGSRPTRLRVVSQGFGGSPLRTIGRAWSYASRFVGSFEVAHRRAREVKYFEKPLQRDEM